MPAALFQAGYPCLSLHGGKEQSDRESTLADFKGAVCNILVATSIAARGLDVRDLVLVVNYDVPNHHEDYVHRWVGCAWLGSGAFFLGGGGRGRGAAHVQHSCGHQKQLRELLVLMVWTGVGVARGWQI